jgi:hypothetical protein
MPLGSSLVRTADYLTNHIGMEKRVSNLETGVHPTTAAVDYFDSTAWTEIVVTNDDLTYAVTGFNQERPYWRKRTGMVSLRGAIQPTGGNLGQWPTIPDDGLEFATLPKNARPATDMRFRTVITDEPWATTMLVKKTGEMLILGEPWDGSGGPVQVRFDGVMWVPEDD